LLNKVAAFDTLFYCFLRLPESGGPFDPVALRIFPCSSYIADIKANARFSDATSMKEGET
jgi:hypothetical protein